MNSFDTGFELATALVRPHILRQPKNGLQKNILNKISVFLSEEANVALPADGNLFQKLGDTRKNCKKYLQDIGGIDYKATKAKLSKNNSQCQKCGVACCSSHSLKICRDHGL